MAGDRKTINADIRGDAVLWLEEQGGAVGEYQAFLEQLRLTLNQALFLGLFESEIHFAVYPPAAITGGMWIISGVLRHDW
ncbi:MAG: hypothetical protein R3E89_09190 [Thiolinea sp.]